jgi:spore maturation protein CgeB
MNDLLDRNIAALRDRNPALAERLEQTAIPAGYGIEEARNGEPTLKVRGLSVHSGYNPAAEAEEWANRVAEDFPPDSGDITVLGFGLGHHLKALAARGYRGAVIEPDLGILRAAFTALPLTEVIEQFTPIAGLEADIIRRRHGNDLTREVLITPAGLRVAPETFRELATYAGALRKARRGGLKILVVNPIYGGSLPAARHAAQALTQLGHEVEVFGAEAFGDGMAFVESFRFDEHRQDSRRGLASLLSQLVELKVRECSPDLVVALAQAPLMPESLERLKLQGIPVAFWFVEDYRVLTYWQELARHYSYFFCIQKGEFTAELERAGVKHHAYLPTAAEPGIHSPLELTPAEQQELGSDLSFVGAGYYNRQRFFRGLLDYDFKIWGSDWPLVLPLAPFIQRGGARIDTETCVKIFNASAVNLNLHSSTYLEGVDPTGDFVNPRTFELASCEAFQLVDQRQLMGELFEEGELEIFTGLKDLREKIDFFLAHPDQRLAVATKGRQRVLHEHTYLHRMEELLAHVLAAYPEVADEQERRLNERDSLLDTLDRDGSLRILLERVQDGGAFRLSEIFKAVEAGEEKLSRAEKIFLMLKNIDVVREVKRL